MSLVDHNPCYQGPYTVELYDGTDTSIAPSGARVEGQKVHISVGTVQQAMGGIQLYSNGSPFFWGYSYIRRITGRNDEILWENWNEKK